MGDNVGFFFAFCFHVCPQVSTTVGDHVEIPGVVLFLLFAFTFVPRLVLRWGTTLESLVLFFFCFQGAAPNKGQPSSPHVPLWSRVLPETPSNVDANFYLIVVFK